MAYANTNTVGNECCYIDNYVLITTEMKTHSQLSLFSCRAAVLIIYLTTQLTFDNDEATLIYHSYMMLTFFVAIFGAIVSDSWLGKYRTVLVMFLLGIAGMLLLNLGSVPTLMLPRRELTIIALLIIGLGTGCMKPCVLAFGGDQFRIPEQLHLMSAYFSMVYFVLKLSAFVGTALTPMLRHDVSCFGQDSCFLLAFGVSGTILLIALSEYLRKRKVGGVDFE